MRHPPRRRSVPERSRAQTVQLAGGRPGHTDHKCRGYERFRRQIARQQEDYGRRLRNLEPELNALREQEHTLRLTDDPSSAVLLEDLPAPSAHGDLRPRNVLLPRAGAQLAEMVLIDFDAAREIADDRAPLADDLHAFAELLILLSQGHASPAGAPTERSPFGTLVRRCLAAPAAGEAYASLADPRFWADLRAAEEDVER